MADQGAAAISTILDRLHNTYPNATYELNWNTPLELLVATILAAQCTDERVNRVTESLFKKYKSARDYADADTAELEEAVRPTGTYRMKAKSIQGACRVLLDKFNGKVPRTMEEMLQLPGVARKTANVVLNCAFNEPSGVIVDTHVQRTSRRLGLTTQEKPERIEEDLMELVPKGEWTFFGPALVLHGRYTCTANDPKCPDCVLNSVCEKNGVEGGGEAAPMPAKKFGAKKSSKPAAGAKPAPSKGASGAPLRDLIPASWRPVLADEINKPYFDDLEEFVREERQNHQVFPPDDQVFTALELTPYEDVHVLLLGQDPYHDDGQAHGLCFSVQPGVPPPPSLVNTYKELQSDVGCKVPNNGYLVPWAEQGVLMLNAVLTVRAHSPNSHKNKGWEKFTDAVLRKVNDKNDPVVFVLWGGYAQKKKALIDTGRHTVIEMAHPSPLSAKAGFFGSKPFSKTNAALKAAGHRPIDWQIPNI